MQVERTKLALRDLHRPDGPRQRPPRASVRRGAPGVRLPDVAVRRQHKLVRPVSEGWTVSPWIDENLNPDKKDWIARTLLRQRKAPLRERGKDYNHSTFCDLVISGLVGFVPNGEKGFAVDPLADPAWDYFVLDNLRYRGHDVAIRYLRGKGLSVEVDGVKATVSGGGNSGKFYTSGNQWRLYQTENATLSFSSEKTIVAVSIEYVSYNTGVLLTSEGSVVTPGQTVTQCTSFLVGNSESGVANGQARVTKMTVTVK